MTPHKKVMMRAPEGDPQRFKTVTIVQREPNDVPISAEEIKALEQLGPAIHELCVQEDQKAAASTFKPHLIPNPMDPVLCVNIWDDYLEEEEEGTYAYIESPHNLPLEDQWGILNTVMCSMINHAYAPAAGEPYLHITLELQTLHELGYVMPTPRPKKRWVLTIKGMSHVQREHLVDCIEAAPLQYCEVPIEVYSES